MSQALVDLDITHEEFRTIVNEKEKYEQKKESIRNIKRRDELSKNSRDIREIVQIHRCKKVFQSIENKYKNCKYQPCRIFLKESLAMQVTKDCRTKPAAIFRTKLGFRQHDPIMTQEQSVLTKIMTVFAAEETILQYNVLGYRVDEYLPKHKLGIEIDEQDDMSIDRSIDYETERQKAI